ncbi:MAG: ABC transporter ATP-binding protein [Candidatus Bathyarchaeia archaeon]
MGELVVEGLRAYYFPTDKPPLRAVDDVSFELEEGSSMGFVGESGCGKSTLGLALLRLLPFPGRIVSGTARLNGIDLMSLPEGEFDRLIRWKRISMIFQGAMNALSPVYTIGDQLSEPFIYRSGLSKGDARKLSIKALEEVGLDEGIMDRYPHELSGGMKQRAMIAMALALRPEILIADEPTTALDVVVQAQILNLLKDLRRRLGISIILLTHDLGVISEIADSIAVMYAGELVELGPSDLVFSNPKHPYTRGLIAAVPRIRGGKSRPTSIPGSPPDLANPPKGCRFRPRCSMAMPYCERAPSMIEVGADHVVRCWLYA